MSSWISEIVKMYEENEAPSKFFYWAGMTALSAVIKKQVYLDRFQYKLYPNIFALIIGPPGIKKALPIAVTKQLVEKIDNTRVISGRKSIQKIVSDLGKTYHTSSGQVLVNAQGLIISGELAALFVKDPDALTILTELFDTDKHEKFWENSLKSGVDKLKEPCLTILGASNEEHLGSALTSSDIKGGFVARTFMILGNQRSVLNSLTEAPKQLPNLDGLSDYLRMVSLLNGTFVWTSEGKQLYDSWYYDFYAKQYHDPTGTLNRLGDQVLKAAMLISLSYDLSLDLKQEHIFEAITVCEECVNGMIQVTMGNGTHSLAQSLKIVMRELVLNPAHEMKKSQILSKYYGQMDDFDIIRIAETLQASQAITITQCGKDMIYKLNKKALDMYQDFKKGIQ